jgi:tetratricopeptide (TPR) repeat protein
MPGTEIVRKQSVLGGAAGIALLAFALVYRFYPTSRLQEPTPTQPQPSLPVQAPVSTLAPLPYTAPTLEAPAPTPALPNVAGTTPAPNAETAPAAPPPKAIAALLKRADKAFAEEHFTEPREGSALALYQQALDGDKDNAQAKQGLAKVHDALLAQAQNSLDHGDERESERLIGQFASLPGTEDEVAGLRGREKILKQVNPLLSHAADRLRDGHATTPPNDSALGAYRQVLKLDPANKLADAGLGQIERGFLERALAAAAQDNFDVAYKVLADASSIRPGSQELQDTRSRIEGIRRERAQNTLAQANSALDAGDAELARLLEQKALGISSDLGGVDEFERRWRNARLYASFNPGQVINDKFLDRAGTAPALVVIPTGTFAMGSPASEDGHRASEEPQREVKIDAGFALGRYDVTVGEFRRFVDDSN